MSDLIDRQVAIDKMQMFIDRMDKEATAYKSLSVAFDRCIIELKRMPPTQTDERLKKIADLLEGTIDHFDRNDAMDLLYQIKEVLK